MSCIDTKKFQKAFYFLAVFILIGFGFFAKPAPVSAACEVVSAGFRVEGQMDPENFYTSYLADQPLENQNVPYVYVDVVTTPDCVGQDLIDISIEEDSLPIESQAVGVANDLSPGVLTDESFTMVFLAGEEQCGAAFGAPDNTDDWDCDYYLIIDYPGGSFSTLSQNSSAMPGELHYECDGLCNFTWGRVPTSGVVTVYPIGYTDELDAYVNTPPFLPEGYGEIDDAYLAPLPGLAGQPSGLKGFLQGLFNVLIIVAGILALVMIVIGAITYLSSDALSHKTEGRDMMVNAVFGLILALGSWVIINTINPNLAANLSITIPKAYLGNYSFSEPGVVSVDGIPTGVTPNEDAGSVLTGSICKNPINRAPGQCTTCQQIPSPVGFSGGAIQENSTQATPQLGAKLLALKQATDALGINWVVTEAYPPSRPHCSQKHYLGTTVDADFSGLPNPSPAQVRAFIDAAASVGLDADWEVATSAEFNAMVAAGLLPGEEVFNFGGWISGSHFSIYN